MSLFLALLGLLVVPAYVSTTAAARAAGPATVEVLNGSTPQTAVFPNDRFTVADPRQLSGRRIALGLPACTGADISVCDGLALLDQLDGFDLQPRVTIPFSGPIRMASVTPATVWVQGPNEARAGLFELVFDPATDILEGTVDRQLREDTTYTIVVSQGVRDRGGHPIAAETRVSFTTESATAELDHIRHALDNGSAYTQAGIPAADRHLYFHQGRLTTVFAGSSVVKEGITRNDQVYDDPTKPLASSTVPDVTDPGSVGWYAFGSVVSPQFVNADAVIGQVPTTQTPPALSAARLGFIMVLPNGTPPAGGWPVAIYGPALARSDFDLLATADHLAALGIATVATDPLGEGYGPRSTITVTHSPTSGAPAVQDTFLSYGRGRDLAGAGTIGPYSGIEPSDHKVISHGSLVADTPSPDELVGTRDGLIQTTADQMVLARVIERGVKVPTANGPVALSRSRVEYYGLSLGAMYGTMLLAVDPEVGAGYLSAGGGPMVEIERLGVLRSLMLEPVLKTNKPDLLNGGPGLGGFTESWPVPTSPPTTHPYPGSAAIRTFLAEATWLQRQGSPEAFAPLLASALQSSLPGTRARGTPKVVEFANGFGDATVPNLTFGNIVRAGNLFGHVTYYRNDRTPTSGTDPHTFLEDPFVFGRSMAEEQLGIFLSSNGRNVTDPDEAQTIFEVPIQDSANLWCLHYPTPQSGQGVYPQPAAGPCPSVKH